MTASGPSKAHVNKRQKVAGGRPPRLTNASANSKIKSSPAAKPPPSTEKSSKPSVSFAQSSPSNASKNKKARVQSPLPVLSKKSVPPVSGKGKEKSAVGPSSKSNSKRKASANLSSSTAPSSPTLPTAFIIAVGSYEKLLYGLEGTYPSSSSSSASSSSSSEPPKPTLTPAFIFPAHVSSVKAVAASPDGGKWLATGGTDETIKVWDLRRRKEVGGLMQHQGSITQLQFVSRSHLISASEDGTIALFHTRDWEVLVTLKGHKGRVNSVAVHPTGKLALSVGKDRALRMWDLMRGKPSASTLLGKEAELVRWSLDGKRFIVQSGNTVDVYRTDMTLIQTIVHPARIQDVRFCRHPQAKGENLEEDEMLLVGAEDKKISVYVASTHAAATKTDDDAEQDKDETFVPVYQLFAELTGHSNRIKAFATLSISRPSSSPSSSPSNDSTTILASTSSDGKIHVYDLSAVPLPSTSPSLSSPKPPPSVPANPIGVGSILKSTDAPAVPQIEPIATYDTKGSRLTCLTMTGIDAPVKSGSKGVAGVKRSRDDDSDEDRDEGEEESEWGI